MIIFSPVFLVYFYHSYRRPIERYKIYLTTNDYLHVYFSTLSLKKKKEDVLRVKFAEQQMDFFRVVF